MGCDIHWIIERRDGDGTWHAVDSKSRFFDARVDFKQGWDRIANQAEYRLGQRDYDLFSILSGVRPDEDTPNSDPLMEEDLPEDASPYVHEQYDSDCHSWGWANGATIASWHNYANESLKKWLGALEAVLDSGLADEIIPARVEIGDDWGHPDLLGAETGHETLARAALSKTLLDWRADPAAWRVLVYYDN